MSTPTREEFARHVLQHRSVYAFDCYSQDDRDAADAALCDAFDSALAGREAAVQALDRSSVAIQEAISKLDALLERLR